MHNDDRVQKVKCYSITENTVILSTGRERVKTRVLIMVIGPSEVQFGL